MVALVAEKESEALVKRFFLGDGCFNLEIENGERV
jgi:hypothetical protein